MATSVLGERTILVGKKPVMNYVLACLTAFQNGSGQVILKARGRAISKAVDAALLTVERFSSDSAVRRVAINTERLRDLDSGGSKDVSSIEIELVNPTDLGL